MTTKKDDAPDKSRKRKRIVPTRVAGAPVNPAFSNPADDLFAEAFEKRGKETTQPQTDSQVTAEPPAASETPIDFAPAAPTPTRQGNLAETKEDSETVAPINNYQKVPNAITKEAIPQGLFRAGKSKHVYDVLYGLTRGAVTPARTVRISKPKLRKLAGVSARATMDACLAHLEIAGLVRQKIHRAGFHEGNEFEVFTPEEVAFETGFETPGTLLSMVGQIDHAKHAKKLGSVAWSETDHGKQGLNNSEQTTYANPKTSLKTFKENDDELLSQHARESLAALAVAARAATGKNLTEKDWEAFAEIINLIIGETEIARMRTESVSAYLKFAAENLRRRLYGKPRQFTGKTRPKKFEPGSQTENLPDDEDKSVEVESLTDDAKENALIIFRSIIREAGIGAMESFRALHTKEDFQWLMERLKTD